MSKGHIHHIEIYVSNLHKSSIFWGWFLEELGYQSYQEWEKGRSWKLDDSYIVFVQTEDNYLEKSYHRKQVGLNHLAFHADSRHHVDAITRQLKEMGLCILYEDLHPYAGGPSHYAVYFEDPDRIKVELVAP
ncbi:VOC family protein [Oceanobacillus massiliensis]|uniref:VOC family protein n=2 Tax=Oceanobacillus massiliensis TaxID=1465765 RepID=UPI0002883407|nr:VOC family protein [Oceanobacillus massiliensis]